jgi:apolipoprotein N-acyltransferase
VKLLGLAAGAIGAFHFAYLELQGYPLVPVCALAMMVFLACLVALARLVSPRRAFNWGVAIGLAIYAPHLSFFWNVFGPPAVALWMVLPIWLGAFLALTSCCHRRFPAALAAVLIPFLWTGIEYFRSELYPLRFSWLNLGYAFSDSSWATPSRLLGMYGVGFLLSAVAGWGVLAWRVRWHLGWPVFFAGMMAFWALGGLLPRPAENTSDVELRIAGAQLEFPKEEEVLRALDEVRRKHPRMPLLVLSEYTFEGPVPERVKAWCRENQRWLIAGGKDPAPGGEFYNTAFVVSTNGEVAFKQAKSVPIQFFNDGLPAREQRVWGSPWGKIGICICYDLGYTRVTDELIRQGAQAIICPTMDVESWGWYEHELHARVAPVRGAEYGVPIVRLASSGISQFVDAHGFSSWSRFPGQGQIEWGILHLPRRGHLPWDRVLAPVASGVTAMLAAFVLLRRHPDAETPTYATKQPTVPAKPAAEHPARQ